MNDDAALLRRFVEERSEAAFAELVQRYVDLVYRASLRRTRGDTHLSADVTQVVFTALASNAHRLSPDTVLGAWLHTASRNAAQKVMISEQRRRIRDTRAYAMETSPENVRPDPDWEQVRPVLDKAIDELPDLDRTSLVLRFFDRRTYSEIGEVLQISEDAARMRTDRALDKLRKKLSRHGITSTATALSIVISSEPMIAAPAGLAATLTVNSLAAAGSGIALSALTSFMTAKIITTAGISAVVAFWAGSYFGFSSHPKLSPSTAEVNGKKMAILRSDDDAAQLRTRIAQQQSEIARLQGILENSAPKADEAFESALEVWLGKQRRLANFLAKNPHLYIPQMEVLTAEDWLDATKVQDFDTEVAYRKALGALRGKARSKFSPQIGAAIKQAIAAIGQAPTDPLAVAPYLPPGFNIEILKQLDVNPSGEVPLLKSIGGAGPNYVFADRPVDIWDGTHYYNTEGGYVTRSVSVAPGEVAVAAAITAFTRDNGNAPTQITDLSGYKGIDALPRAQVNSIFKALTTKM